MKHQKSCGPHLGKSVHQLPEVVTLEYNLCFRRTIVRWKYLSKDYKFLWKIHDEFFQSVDTPKKTSFRASKRLRKLRTQKTAKNSKLPKLPEICFHPIGKGGWPLISTWINTSSLGRNGLHCVEFPHQMRKFLLNLSSSVSFALV